MCADEPFVLTASQESGLPGTPQKTEYKASQTCPVGWGREARAFVPQLWTRCSWARYSLAAPLLQ